MAPGRVLGAIPLEDTEHMKAIIQAKALRRRVRRYRAAVIISRNGQGKVAVKIALHQQRKLGAILAAQIGQEALDWSIADLIAPAAR